MNLLNACRALRAVYRLRRGKPTLVSFNVSNRCNEACPMCSVWQEEGPELPLAEIAEIFAELRRFGFLVAEISGGEPFLRPDLFELFALLDRLGFLYTTTSNGTLLNRERLGRLNEAKNLLQLAVSLDTLDRDTYRTLRGRDLLGEVLQNLELVALSPPPQPVKLNMTLSRVNYGEVYDLLNYAKARGFYLSVFPVSQGEGFAHRAEHPQYRATDRERQEMAAVFTDLARRRQAGEPLWEYSGFYQKAADYLLGRPMGPCGAGRLFADLRAEGRLAACVDLPPFADLRSERLADAWGRCGAQDGRVARCAEASPCCYTCTYNVALTAQKPLAFLRESLRVRLARGRGKR